MQTRPELTERFPNAISPESVELTQRFLGRESEAPGADLSIAFSACEKLRRPLSMLMGTSGYRALIQRALTLARRTSPALECVNVREDGSLVILDAEALPAGIVVAESLIGLLLSFVGEAITLRLLQDVWPDPDGLNTRREETDVTKG